MLRVETPVLFPLLNFPVVELAEITNSTLITEHELALTPTNSAVYAHTHVMLAINCKERCAGKMRNIAAACAKLPLRNGSLQHLPVSISTNV